MLQECIDVFKNQLQQPDGETLILDQYVPKDGTYYLITRKAEHTFELDEPLEISYDKKKKEIIGEMDERYEFMKFLDYNSKLLEMNKPIDPKKQIHSNNYLTFFVKKDALKDGKVTKEIIEGYYKILEDLTLKYKKGNARKIFDKTVELIGELDREFLLEIKEWISNFDFSELQYSDKKDYLKLFFILEDKNATKQLYEKEGKRYLLPNIFNSNDFNVEVDGEIWGLPNDNLNMNGKKPFLGHLSRNEKVPCLISQEDALLRSQFFDYLMGLASIGKYNVYIDFEGNRIDAYRSGEKPQSIENGCFLRIQKGKEVEIHRVEQVVKFNSNMKKTFSYINYFGLKKEDILTPESAKTIGDIESKINMIFFNGKLTSNYFTDAKDITLYDSVLKQSILTARDRIFTYFHTNQEVKLIGMMKPLMWDLIHNVLTAEENDFGKKKKLREQLNLRWALLNYWNDEKEEIKMPKVRQSVREKINKKEDWEFTFKEEYYYAAGQVIAYLFSLSKAKSVPASEINPFLNVKNKEQFLERLLRIYQKYNYSFELKNRFQRTFARLQQVREEWELDRIWLVAGFADDNLFYEKSKVENNKDSVEKVEEE
ncbi:MAG: hypothetical protein IAC13_10320 [Firmicutes bacterium]|uniref:Uncharacterized protein n=1 Tax=Candidatus Scybalomonas excrementavium TaxID=2840943 RepID=A0A9D9N8D6_9FIRM|nr:hypothetical protein [Candidatus Scybalomonas excrementavium]